MRKTLLGMAVCGLLSGAGLAWADHDGREHRDFHDFERREHRDFHSDLNELHRGAHERGFLNNREREAFHRDLAREHRAFHDREEMEHRTFHSDLRRPAHSQLPLRWSTRRMLVLR